MNANEMTHMDALVLAMKLAITAPTDDKFEKAKILVEELASGLSEFEIALAKRKTLANLYDYEQT